MKKSVLLIFGLFILFGFMGVVSADETSDFCNNVDIPSDPTTLGEDIYPYKAECGTYKTDLIGSEVSCGTCGEEGVCIQGKCHSLNELGGCFSESNIEEEVEACSELGNKCLVSKEEGLWCRYENYQIYTPVFYWKKIGGLKSNKFGRQVITITDDMLQDPDMNIPLKMVIEDSLITLETETAIVLHDFSIGSIDIDLIPVVVEEEGTIEVEFNITKEFLNKINYDGYSQIEFRTLDLKYMEKYPERGGYPSLLESGRSNGENIIRVYPSVQLLVLQSKKGECRGTIPCTLFNEGMCSEVYYETSIERPCNWDDEGGCIGEGLTCEGLEEEEECLGMVDSIDLSNHCSWKRNSIWVRFTSWLKSLFGK